jgi:hypothetical protein
MFCCNLVFVSRHVWFNWIACHARNHQLTCMHPAAYNLCPLPVQVVAWCGPMTYLSHPALHTQCVLGQAGLAQGCGEGRAGLAARAQRWRGEAGEVAALVVLVAVGPWARASREVVAWVAPAAARPGPLVLVTWLAVVVVRAATQVTRGKSKQ